MSKRLKVKGATEAKAESEEDEKQPGHDNSVSSLVSGSQNNVVILSWQPTLELNQSVRPSNSTPKATTRKVLNMEEYLFFVWVWVALYIRISLIG